MSTSKPSRTPSIESLDRGLTVLRAVADSKKLLSVDDLASLVNVDRSSAFRFVQTLRRRGFLGTSASQTGRHHFTLGSEIWRLSKQYNWGGMLKSVAAQPLKLLSVQVNATAHLAMRVGHDVHFISAENCGRTIFIGGQEGTEGPVHCMAHGKATLVDMDRSQLCTTLGNNALQKYTERTISDIETLSKNLSLAKSRGFAADEGEYQEGLCGFAAPIRVEGDDILGSVGILLPCVRSYLINYRTYAEPVCKAADIIGELLRPH